MAIKKRRKPSSNGADIVRPVDKKVTLSNLARLGALVLVTAVVFVSYRLLVSTRFAQITLIAYMTVAAAAILTYVIYNRGFSRKGVTEDMLPDSMTSEQKAEFIADGEQRLKKSRPLLIVIFAFAFTFIADVIELIAIPFLGGLFK